MLYIDVLSIIMPLIQDWKSLFMTSVVCKAWHKAVQMYAGTNVRTRVGRFKGRYIHELAVTYPSYIEYLYSSCHQLYLYKLLNITQSRLDLRYLRLSFGKYNGQLLRCVPSSYLRWLVSASIDAHTKLGACR